MASRMQGTCLSTKNKFTGVNLHRLIQRVQMETGLTTKHDFQMSRPKVAPPFEAFWLMWSRKIWKKGKDPHPQDKIQHLDFTKEPRPLYYKTPPCVFTTKMSVVRPFSVLSKDEIGP